MPSVSPSHSESGDSDDTQELILRSNNYNRRATLNAYEQYWSSRYDFLHSRGYKLRPRYRPGWSGSWLETKKKLWECEDALETFAFIVLDASTVRDGQVVCIKRIVEREDQTQSDGLRSDQVEIAQFLSSPPLSQDDNNHCVTIIDAFRDPVLHVNYMVMPVLRTYDDPPFGTVGEVIDFVGQILEGMEFMHRHLVSHGDLTPPNIMMDARPLLPQGWHFADEHLAPNGVDTVTPFSRTNHPVRYIIIDYDTSVWFRPDESHMISRPGGRDSDPPELNTFPMEPYDAFKLDVFTVGNTYSKEFVKVYHGLDFLINLTDMMMKPDFRHRCTAQGALQYWSTVKSDIHRSIGRRWLRKRGQSVVDLVVQALTGLRRLT